MIDKLDRYINYRQLPDLILSIDPDLNMAWRLKERYTMFNATVTCETAPQQLEDLTCAFVLANIPEYKDFTTAISNWQKEIANSFLDHEAEEAVSASSIFKKIRTIWC